MADYRALINTTTRRVISSGFSWFTPGAGEESQIVSSGSLPSIVSEEDTLVLNDEIETYIGRDDVVNLVVTDGGTTEYVIDTDYTYNEYNSTVARVGGGAIGNGATVTVSYDVLASVSDYKVAINGDVTFEPKPKIRAYIGADTTTEIAFATSGEFSTSAGWKTLSPGTVAVENEDAEFYGIRNYGQVIDLHNIPSDADHIDITIDNESRGSIVNLRLVRPTFVIDKSFNDPTSIPGYTDVNNNSLSDGDTYILSADGAGEWGGTAGGVKGDIAVFHTSDTTTATTDTTETPYWEFISPDFQNVIDGTETKNESVWVDTPSTAQALVYKYDDSATTQITDESSDSRLDDGSNLTFWQDSPDAVFVGKNKPFTAIKVVLSVLASADAGVLIAEYWNGSTWSALTATDGTDVGGNTMRQDGVISFAAPDDWSAGANSSYADLDATYYFVRLKPTAYPTTDPQADVMWPSGDNWLWPDYIVNANWLENENYEWNPDGTLPDTCDTHARLLLKMRGLSSAGNYSIYINENNYSKFGSMLIHGQGEDDRVAVVSASSSKWVVDESITNVTGTEDTFLIENGVYALRDSLKIFLSYYPEQSVTLTWNGDATTTNGFMAGWGGTTPSGISFSDDMTITRAVLMAQTAPSSADLEVTLTNIDNTGQNAVVPLTAGENFEETILGTQEITLLAGERLQAEITQAGDEGTPTTDVPAANVRLVLFAEIKESSQVVKRLVCSSDYTTNSPSDTTGITDPDAVESVTFSVPPSRGSVFFEYIPYNFSEVKPPRIGGKPIINGRPSRLLRP